MVRRIPHKTLKLPPVDIGSSPHTRGPFWFQSPKLDKSNRLLDLVQLRPDSLIYSNSKVKIGVEKIWCFNRPSPGPMVGLLEWSNLGDWNQWGSLVCKRMITILYTKKLFSLSLVYPAFLNFSVTHWTTLLSLLLYEFLSTVLFHEQTDQTLSLFFWNQSSLNLNIVNNQRDLYYPL